MKRSPMFYWFLLLLPAGVQSEPLTLSYAVPLPGVKGRFDHFAISSDRTRLAVAALGNNSVEVLDLPSKSHRLSIAGQHKPCGVQFSADGSIIFAANGDDGTLKTIDAKSGDIKASLAGLEDADNLRKDAEHFFVGYGSGGLAAVKITDGKLSYTIPLKAHPESFQLELKGPRIFVNLPDAHEVAVVDRSMHAVAAAWPLGKWGANFPMALDEEGHRLFLGCRKPSSVVALDTRDGHELGHVEISGDTDDLFYDAKRQHLYISCGEGFVDTLDVKPGSALKRIGHQATRARARTSFFSPAADLFWVAVPASAGREAEIRAYAPSISARTGPE